VPFNPLVVTAVVAVTTAAAVVDLRTRRVPNWLTFGTAALGVTMATAQAGGIGVAGALGGLLVGLVLMLPGHVFGKTGAGDVKLLAALGTLLGPRSIAMAFLYTAIAGGVLAVLVATKRRRLRETLEGTATLVVSGGGNAAEIEKPSTDNRFAYAPAIAIGAVVAAFGWW
jgi:prepilin peptidase CpaA